MNDILCICKICGLRTKNLNGLSQHLKNTHNISQQKYYDLYIKEYNEGICPCCGSETVYNKFGYRRFCSKRCNGLFTLQQTQENISKRVKSIHSSEKIKLSHCTKEFKSKLSKIKTEFYKNDENRQKLSEACIGNRIWTSKQKEEKSKQMCDIISTFKNMARYEYENELYHSSWEFKDYKHIVMNKLFVNSI